MKKTARTSTNQPLSRLHSWVACSLLGGTLAACGGATPPAESAPADIPTPPAADQRPAGDRVSLGAIQAEGFFLPPLPTAVTSFGSAASDSDVFLVGGYSGTPHAYSKEGQSNEIWALARDGKSGWRKVGALPMGVQGIVSVTYRGALCSFGGSHASNEAQTPTVMHSLKEASCFDPASSTWKSLPPLPRGRSSHAGAVVGSTVYLAGGWTLDGDASRGVFEKDLLALDLDKPDAGWKSIPAPFSRRAVGVAVLGSKLVIVGGMTDDGRPAASVDVYDTATGAWTRGPDFPGDAFGIAAAPHGDRVVASGREGVLRSWKPGQDSWTDVRRLAFGRFFHQLVPIGDELVVLGGIGGMHTRGRTRPVEKVSLAPGPSFGKLTFDYPGVAKNRQGILAHGEEIYLFGGNVSLEQHDFERKHFTSEGWIFDFATLELRKSTPYPFARQTMQTLSTEQGGLSVGGFGHEPLAGDKTQAVSHPEGFSFNGESWTWSERQPLPRGRTQFGMVTHDDTVWILGGLNYDPNREGAAAFDHDTTILTTKLSDPKAPFQVADIRLPGPRRAFAGARLGDKYYLVGGMKEGFQLVENCLEFDLVSKTFAELPCPAARLSGDLIPAGGKLYLVGGSVRGKDGIEESNSIEVYDPKTRAWSVVPLELPVSARHLRALPYRDQILLLTTHTEEAKMTVVVISPGL